MKNTFSIYLHLHSFIVSSTWVIHWPLLWNNVICKLLDGNAEKTCDPSRNLTCKSMLCYLRNTNVLLQENIALAQNIYISVSHSYTSDLYLIETGGRNHTKIKRTHKKKSLLGKNPCASSSFILPSGLLVSLLYATSALHVSHFYDQGNVFSFPNHQTT